jgi:hypothetical protein
MMNPHAQPVLYAHDDCCMVAAPQQHHSSQNCSDMQQIMLMVGCGAICVEVITCRMLRGSPSVLIGTLAGFGAWFASVMPCVVAHSYGSEDRDITWHADQAWALEL